MIGRLLEACCCCERGPEFVVAKNRDADGKSSQSDEDDNVYVHVSSVSPLPPHYKVDPSEEVSRVSATTIPFRSDISLPLEEGQAGTNTGNATRRATAKERLKTIVRNFIAQGQGGMPVSVAESSDPTRLSPAVFKMDKLLAFSVSRSNTVVESDIEYVDYRFFSNVIGVQKGFQGATDEDAAETMQDLAITILFDSTTPSTNNQLVLVLSDKLEQERFFVSLSILRMVTLNSHSG